MNHLVKKNFLGDTEPYKVNLAVTYKCNQRCSTCNIWEKGGEPIDKHQIREFFEKNRYIKWLSLTGGEPFLREDIVDIVESADQELDNLFILNIPTNGLETKRTLEAVKDFLKTDIPHIIVTVSINGPKETHDKIAGVKGSWKNAIKTFKSLKEIENVSKNFKTFFEYTQSDMNKGKFDETFEKIKEKVDIGNDDIAVTFFHTSEHYYGNNEKEFDREEQLEEVEDIIDIQKNFPKTRAELINQIFLRLSKSELEENSISCEAMKSSVFIDPFGNVFPCVIDPTRLGNIVEQDYDLRRILEGTDKRMIIDRCEGCWLPCEANQKIMSNFPFAVKEYIKNFFV